MAARVKIFLLEKDKNHFRNLLIYNLIIFLKNRSLTTITLTSCLIWVGTPLSSSNFMTFYDIFDDLFQILMTLGTAVTFKYFPKLFFVLEYFKHTQFNINKRWCPPKWVPF